MTKTKIIFRGCQFLVTGTAGVHEMEPGAEIEYLSGDITHLLDTSLTGMQIRSEILTRAWVVQ